MAMAVAEQWRIARVRVQYDCLRVGGADQEDIEAGFAAASPAIGIETCGWDIGAGAAVQAAVEGRHDSRTLLRRIRAVVRCRQRGAGPAVCQPPELL